LLVLGDTDFGVSWRLCELVRNGAAPTEWPSLPLFSSITLACPISEQLAVSRDKRSDLTTKWRELRERRVSFLWDVYPPVFDRALKEVSRFDCIALVLTHDDSSISPADAKTMSAQREYFESFFDTCARFIPTNVACEIKIIAHHERSQRVGVLYHALNGGFHLESAYALESPSSYGIQLDPKGGESVHPTPRCDVRVYTFRRGDVLHFSLQPDTLDGFASVVDTKNLSVERSRAHRLQEADTSFFSDYD